MYDPVTRDLIADSPPLRGLDRNRLPEELTRVYAEIVSIRLGISSASTPPSAAHLAADLERLRRLANTYESYVTTSPDGASREAAAFVAATAHHLLHRARALVLDQHILAPSLGRDWLSPVLSAMLLFLIAGHYSDAIELSHVVVADLGSRDEIALVSAIVALARGRLTEIIAQEDQEGDKPQDEDAAAKDLLWRTLHNGVYLLAQRLLTGEALDPASVFLFVERQAVRRISIPGTDDFFISSYAGPHHLARLLRSATDTLLAGSLKASPAPQGAAEAWGLTVNNIVQTRPFLWPNHKAAIAAGIMTPGTSAVLSLPTGSGKTTLADLKIGIALANGVNVVFLAPTHALVDQVARHLRTTFPNSEVSSTTLPEGQFSEAAAPALQAITVLTPEACLTLLSVAPELFSGVGLLVFDECHLMHCKDVASDRRSVDSTLTLLKFMDAAPTADLFLMSAMVKNVESLAQWIRQTTARPCVPVSTEWKPTRQARGCVVFDDAEVRRVAKDVRSGRINPKTGSPKKQPNKADIAKARALPYGFISLRQGWTKSKEDYSLLALANASQSVQLGVNKFWNLTPARNQVASFLALQFARLGLKTIVFIQDRRYCENVASQVATGLGSSQPVTLTEEEAALKSLALEEVGGEDSMLGVHDGRALSHHGLLLRPERHLSERLYARLDGPMVIAATPTLAQGMNLPAEVVIIAGDDRRDGPDGAAKQLQAHELLNAAGRAGRAGHVAEGVVLVIPSQLVSFSPKTYAIGNKWFSLADEVFAKTDQCLDICDPLEHLLDLVQTQADPDELSAYMLRRFPQDASSGGAAERMLRRSFAAFCKTSKLDAHALSERVQSVLKWRKIVAGEAAAEDWLENAAVATGVRPQLLSELLTGLLKDSGPPGRSIAEWVSWTCEYIGSHYELFRTCVGFDRLCKMYSIEPTEKSAPEAAKRLAAHTHDWLGGKTLVEIQRSIAGDEEDVGSCSQAREFVIRRIPEVSYLVGVVAQLYRTYLQHVEPLKKMPLTLAVASSCIREGCSDPIELCLRIIAGREISRRECRRRRLDVLSKRTLPTATADFPTFLRQIAKQWRERGVDE